MTIFGVKITDEFMGEFQREGLAKEFNRNGSVKQTITWKKDHAPAIKDGWGTSGRRRGR